MFTVKSITDPAVSEICGTIYDLVAKGSLAYDGRTLTLFDTQIELGEGNPIPTTSYHGAFVRLTPVKARIKTPLPDVADPLIKHVDIYPTHAVAQLSYGATVTFKSK